SNLRTIEKKILDSIIGDGRYDNRIRPSGLNASGATGKFLAALRKDKVI
ncbi:glutamate gated chloride channel GluCl2-like protein, partial [Dinothrombium tinctorium]